MPRGEAGCDLSDYERLREGGSLSQACSGGFGGRVWGTPLRELQEQKHN